MPEIRDPVPHEPTRLIVVLEAGAGALERLAAARQGGDIASLVIRAGGGSPLDAAGIAPLVSEAQRAGIAVLIEADARLARTVKADGVHLPPSDEIGKVFEEARATIGGRAIVGADVGRSRDDAMSIGETGAEYVGFGIPAFVKERDAARERRLELIDWWSEIFEVPCVAFDVETPEDAGDLAAAGADFVAVTLGAGLTPADARDLVRGMSDEIRATSSAADAS